MQQAQPGYMYKAPCSLQQQRSARHGHLALLAAVLLLAVSASAASPDCVISDGKVSPSCFNQKPTVPQQLVTAYVPLDLRVQWGQGHGYCGEVSLQMVAAHHGVWLGQQFVRDLNRGELLVDSMGSVERVLDMLGFSHTSWKPAMRKPTAQSDNDESYSRQAALFLVWMKQSIAQGRVPIFGARIHGERDPDYDHIMPAYNIQFWSPSAWFKTTGSSNSSSSSSSRARTADLGSSGGSSSSSSRTAAGAVLHESAAASNSFNESQLPVPLHADVANIQAATSAQNVAEMNAGADSEDQYEADLEEIDSEDEEGSGEVLADLAAVNPEGAMTLAVDAEPAQFEGMVRENANIAGEGSFPTAQDASNQSSNQQMAGWLPNPAESPQLAALSGLYRFSSSDVLGWANGYGGAIKRAVASEGFFAHRGSCTRTDLDGGCISLDGPSFAVAMGGLVQPPAAAAAAAAAPMAIGKVGSNSAAASAVNLAEAHSLFKPLRLVITTWDKAGSPANTEPLAKLKAVATGYKLDVSSCAAHGQPFTVFRFDGYLAFRSTGQTKAVRKFLWTKREPVLANPNSVQELSGRCVAAKQSCRRATFVQAEGLSVGVKEFGPFGANGSTYFVCVSGAVPAYTH